MRHTGGEAWGAISTRSRPASIAFSSASLILISPIFSSLLPIKNIIGVVISSLMRVFLTVITISSFGVNRINIYIFLPRGLLAVTKPWGRSAALCLGWSAQFYIAQIIKTTIYFCPYWAISFCRREIKCSIRMLPKSLPVCVRIVTVPDSCSRSPTISK